MKILNYNHFSSDPFFNMAFDEWMLQKVIDEKSLICIRLYSWSLGTITFGFNQQSQMAYDNSLVSTTPVLRRVTGGRGLFHDKSELTYSIAVSANLIEEKVVSESIAGASAEFAKILINFLKKLNIISDYVRQSSQCEKDKFFFHRAPCFASFSKNEIVNDGKKIIASAQRRIFGALLQHGSIKINGIKHHKALPLNNYKSMQSKEIKELTLSKFNQYVQLFTTTCEESFAKKTIQGVLSETDRIELKNRELYVRKKSTEKRDFIKQKESLLSL